MTEIEEDERRVGEISENGADQAEGSTPPKPSREKNPNTQALRDVATFQLADDLPPGYRGRGPGRWYYTKPR